MPAYSCARGTITWWRRAGVAQVDVAFGCDSGRRCFGNAKNARKYRETEIDPAEALHDGDRAQSGMDSMQAAG
jgi:hypothetical protein